MPPTPPKKKAAKKTEDMPVLSFEFEGKLYVIDSDVSSGDDLALFQQSRLTFADVGRVAASGGNPPPFIIAALMFLSERQSGNRTVSYSDLADRVTYADLAAGSFVIVDDEDDVPKA